MIKFFREETKISVLKQQNRIPLIEIEPDEAKCHLKSFG